MDGLVFSDHTPTPGLIEYKKAIEPVQILDGGADVVQIINRYDHVTLDHLKAECFVVGNEFRKSGGEVQIPIGIAPGATGELKIDGVFVPAVESYLEVVFTLREANNWAEAGHEVTVGQIQLVKPMTLETLQANPSRAPQFKQITTQLLEITGDDSIWTFNVIHGTLTSWKRSGIEFLHSAPVLDFHRALTDNDVGCHFGKNWTETLLHDTRAHVRAVSYSTSTSALTVTVSARIAPPVLEWSVDATLTYTFTSRNLHIKAAGKPQGGNLPKTFARVGLTLSMNDVDSTTWFGRGPGECYRDKKLSQKLGTFTSSVDDLLTDYEFPQESGNRTDIRWVSFNNTASATGIKASFGDLEDASFTALHYAAADLQAAKHPFELKKLKRKETVVRLDWAHHGLGTGSCGPATLPAHELTSRDFEYEILLE